MRILELLSDVRVLGVLAAVGVIFWHVRVIKQYERGVVFRLGKCRGVRDPGLTFLVPFLDELVRLDLRVVSVDVARQDTMSRDNVPVTVDAVVYMRIVDPERAVLAVEDPQQSTFLIAQTSLRSVIGEASLDQLLGQREEINQRLKALIDRQVIAWGVEVPIVEIKEVSLPESMKRAMAMEAETERGRRARLIRADAEVQASSLLVKAGELLSKEPRAMQLRYLQALSDVSQERSTFVVFPLPIEKLGTLFAPATVGNGRGDDSSGPRTLEGSPQPGPAAGGEAAGATDEG